MDKELKAALELLGGCEWAVLCTASEAGKPYGVPISPVVWGEAVCFHGSYRGKKMRELKKNNHVCISAVGHAERRAKKFTMAFESVILHGTACIVENEEEKMDILRTISEKYAQSNMENFSHIAKKSLRQTCIIKVLPTEATRKKKD